VDHVLEEHRRGEQAIQANRVLHYRDWVDNVENAGLDLEHGVLPIAERAVRVDSLMEQDCDIRFHVWDHTAFIDFFHAACAEAHLEFEVVEVADTLPLGGNELIILARKEPNWFQRAGIRWRHKHQLTSRLKAALKATPAGPLLARIARALRG
jgi:hypothetical protein